MKKNKRIVPETTPEEQYQFRSDFQVKILGMILRDTSFLGRHTDVIKPIYFDNPLFARLCRLILDFYDVYEATPSRESLNELIEGELNKEDQENLKFLVSKVYNISLEDANFVEDAVTEFAKRQAYRRLLILSEQHLRNGDFASIDKMHSVAQCVGADHSDLGDPYFSSVMDRLEYLKNVDAQIRIPTLIASLDKALNGGISPGELNIIMAPPGIGKSIFLVNMAFAGLFCGKRVVYITLEMSAKKVQLRLDTRFTGIPVTEIVQREEEYLRKLALYESKCGRLRVKKFPSSLATVRDIRNYLDSLARIEGFVPELVIVDYLDIIKPANPDEGLYLGQGEIGKSLRSLADDLNIGLWTGTQATRKAAEKDVLSKVDKADCWIVVADADVILGLMRTDKEDLENRARLAIVKVRDADDKTKVINVTLDLKRMIISSLMS